jgi:hypothetical protein
MATEIVATTETQTHRSSIQVEKNSRGFNWTAKLYAAEVETDDELLARMQKVTTELRAAYGSGPD